MRKTALTALILICLVVVPLAGAKKIAQARNVDPESAALSGVQYARILKSRGHPECANVMTHLAFQESEKMDRSDIHNHLAMIDIQLEIIEVALDLGRKDSAGVFVKRCDNFIQEIPKPALRESRKARLNPLKKRLKNL